MINFYFIFFILFIEISFGQTVLNRSFEGASIAMRWDCFHSEQTGVQSPSPRVMSTGIISLPLITQSENNLIDFTPIYEFVQELKNYEVDYFSCLEFSLARFMSEIRQANFANDTHLDNESDSKEQLNPNEQSFLSQLNYQRFLILAEYGEFLEENPYLPPTIIGEPLREVASGGIILTPEILTQLNQRECERGDNFPLAEFVIQEHDSRYLRSSCQQRLRDYILESLAPLQRNESQCEQIGRHHCERSLTITNRYLTYLTQNNLIDGTSFFEELQCRKDSDDFLDLLFLIQSSLNNQSTCVQLEIGQSANVDYQQESGLYSRYFLSRQIREDGKEEYLVDLNLNFVPVPSDHSASPSLLTSLSSTFSSTNDDDIILQMQRRVQECLIEQQDRLQGPDGSLLNIRINSGTSDLKPTNIFIQQDSNFRANSYNYPLSIDCPTIIHELLHLLGLVDTYHEQSNGIYACSDTQQIFHAQSIPQELLDQGGAQNVRFISNYSCRAIAPQESIMHNQNLALGYLSQTTNCFCNPDLEDEQLRDCLRTNERILSERSHKNSSHSPLTECPQNNLILGKDNRESFQELIEKAHELGFDQVSTLDFSQYLQSNNPTVLMPAEFRMITNPGCKSEETNLRYLNCARFAYRAGYQSISASSCQQNRPSYCDDSSWLE